MRINRSILGRDVGLGDNGEFIVNRKDGVQEIFGLRRDVTIANAQVLTLNATPQTIIPAPGAALAIAVRRALIYKPAGTAFAGIAAGEDLVLKVTNAAGPQCTGVAETTGFLDQATDQSRIVHPPGSTGATAADYAPAANQPVVLHLLVGEVITGTSALKVRVWYDLIGVNF